MHFKLTLESTAAWSAGDTALVCSDTRERRGGRVLRLRPAVPRQALLLGGRFLTTKSDRGWSGHYCSLFGSPSEALQKMTSLRLENF